MREILFRGRRKDNGKWVYGSLLKQAGEYISKDEVTPNECWICGMRGEKDLIVSETIGQYTGLCDKNGKEVFEGDIARVFDGEYINGVVGYSLEHGVFTIDNTSLLYWLPDVKIIGNVYDNPELLEEK